MVIEGASFLGLRAAGRLLTVSGGSNNHWDQLLQSALQLLKDRSILGCGNCGLRSTVPSV